MFSTGEFHFLTDDSTVADAAELPTTGSTTSQEERGTVKRLLSLEEPSLWPLEESLEEGLASVSAH